MTQDNLPTDPAVGTSNTPNTLADAISANSRPQKSRKKIWLRRIGKFIGGLIVLDLILALLAPTILSTGTARALVLNRVNNAIDGKVAIGDWSIGWWGGVRAEDVKLFDADQRQILQIPRFRSQISLLGLLRGQIHLGDTSIEGLDFFAEQEADGTLNFRNLIGRAAMPISDSSSEPVTAAAAPGKLLPIDGDIHWINCRGTFQNDQNARTIQITNIAGDVNIPKGHASIGGAMVGLQSSGEFRIDLSDSSGATLKGCVLPFVLSKGTLRVAYAGKPAGDDLPAPAELNGGKLDIGGVTIDLSHLHPTLTIPDGTKILDGVGINPAFARTYLAGWLENPVFAGAEEASGQLFLTMKHGDRLPIDAMMEEDVPANAGVAEIELQLTGVELSSKFLNRIKPVLTMLNPRGRVATTGIQISIPQWTARIEHGIVTQDLKLMIGRNPPLELAGTIQIKTRVMNMLLTIPMSKDQNIQLRVTGTPDEPRIDTKGLLDQGLKNVPRVANEFQKILGKGGDKGKGDSPEGTGN